MDEYLDLVDERDTVIDRKLRSEVYAEQLTNFRVINAFVINAEGQLWIPRRTENKRLFPLCLDIGVGGHVESGETYDEALRRETSEEVNIDISKVTYRLLGKLAPHTDGVSAFMQVYEIEVAEAPRYNPTDYIEYFWLTPGEALARIDGGDKAKGDLPKLIRKFYG